MAHKETYTDAALALAPVDVGIAVGVAVPYSLFQSTRVDIRIDVARIIIILLCRGEIRTSIYV